MKKKPLLIIGLFSFIVLLQAQNDTIYFMKNGLIVNKQSIKTTDIDSAVFYTPPIISPTGSFTDSRDSQVYQHLTIGNQVWIAENLKYLPSVVDSLTGSEIAGFETEAYYYVYGYNGTDVTEAKATANYNTYGVLYNWNAAMAGADSSSTNPSGVQGVCPTGWHLPSKAEWTQLADFLGGFDEAGGKLKEAGLTHWEAPNAGATNETGFRALPGGYRNSLGEYKYMARLGICWTTSMSSANGSHTGRMQSQNQRLEQTGYNIAGGISVRCVRD
ncbi:MAG: fibrobacter succinogenes major paralogous domain-containing protein [Bacteroidales bacterium]|nr:fibrobacter succinogenes major paralogous domain-containing protein [Bacteroidales bacterium]